MCPSFLGRPTNRGIQRLTETGIRSGYETSELWKEDGSVEEKWKSEGWRITLGEEQKHEDCFRERVSESVLKGRNKLH